MLKRVGIPKNYIVVGTAAQQAAAEQAAAEQAAAEGKNWFSIVINYWIPLSMEVLWCGEVRKQSPHKFFRKEYLKCVALQQVIIPVVAVLSERVVRRWL